MTLLILPGSGLTVLKNTFSSVNDIKSKYEPTISTGTMDRNYKVCQEHMLLILFVQKLNYLRNMF